jgi:hypothetical protein
MLAERDATRLWQQLFHGQCVTPQLLNEADSLINQLKPESPLRLRYMTELDEIRKLHMKTGRKSSR